MLSVLPIAFFIGKSGGTPEMIFIIRAMCFIFVLIVQLYFLRKYINLHIRGFAQAVIFPVSLILALSCVFYYIVHLNMTRAETFWVFLYQTLMYEVFIGFLIWTIGLNNSERKQLVTFVLSRIY